MLIEQTADRYEWCVWLVMAIVVTCVRVPEQVRPVNRQLRVVRQHVRCTAYKIVS